MAYNRLYSKGEPSGWLNTWVQTNRHRARQTFCYFYMLDVFIIVMFVSIIITTL